MNSESMLSLIVKGKNIFVFHPDSIRKGFANFLIYRAYYQNRQFGFKLPHD